MTNNTATKVLMVDDEKFLLEMYSIKFLKSGFDLVISTSSFDALQKLKNGYTPDVILFDINMPENSGYEFLEALSHLPIYKTCVKIALTNESQPGGINRTAELGADGYLLKANFTPGEIVNFVNTMLQKKGRATS